MWSVLALAGVVPTGAELRVTYLANEGFLLDSGEARVLIDALFDRGVEGYATLPPAMLSAARTANAPFDRIDLILATHYHADHFDAGTVIAHLRSNPAARFVSTPQAIAKIEALADGDRRILDRVEGVFPPEGNSISKEWPGIHLEVLNLHHGRGGRPEIENLGFLVEMGGLTWLHIGDTEATVDDFRPYSLRQRSIDVAIPSMTKKSRARSMRIRASRRSAP